MQVGLGEGGKKGERRERIDRKDTHDTILRGGREEGMEGGNARWGD